MFYLAVNCRLLKVEKCLSGICNHYGGRRSRNYTACITSLSAKQRQIRSNLNQTRVQASNYLKQIYSKMLTTRTSFDAASKIWNFQEMVKEVEHISNRMKTDQCNNNLELNRNNEQFSYGNNIQTKEQEIVQFCKLPHTVKKRRRSKLMITKTFAQERLLLQGNHHPVNSQVQQCQFSTLKNGIHSEVAISDSSIENLQKKENSSATPSLSKLFPQPKYSLNNVFIALSQHFNDKSYLIKPNYIQKIQERSNFQWVCNITLKWPKEMTFTSIGPSHKSACNKASMLALQNLYSDGYITSKSLPVLPESKKAVVKKHQEKEVILLKPAIIRSMESIVEDYERKMLPCLQHYGAGDDNDGDVQATEEIWPVNNDTQFRFKFRGVEFYSCEDKKPLPISNYKENIINTVQTNRVVIIKGEPGCGKSTRVPQYILEAWARDYKPGGSNCRIVVTQPRRLAAISLAERVSSERNESLGHTVGYQVRLKSAFDRKTGKILFCTSGILLRHLQSDQGLMDCSHIILDEAHERDVNTDLLLNLLKVAMAKNPDLKLLVMSATIKAEVFQEYFKQAAIVHVPGFTHPVSVKFLGKNCGLDTTYTMANGSAPSVVHEDIAELVHRLNKNKPKGAILVFLPGWQDITRVKTLIGKHRSIDVLCLHSRMPHDEQRKIFQHYPDGIRKVILATNIAETSITIDDVVYVVDSGIQKENRFDVEKGITVIDNHWISKASMAQRKGRAGRVQAGEAFLLYPKSKFDEFSDYSIPEIQRTSLTKIVLDSKVYSNNMKAAEFLGQLITPPETSAIARAVKELIELDLLDAEENLTPLGKVISDFQLEPKLAKALVNSVIYKCVTPVVDIVTYFSAEMEVFAGGLVEKEKIKSMKQDFSQSSDHLSMMRLFEKWLELVEDGRTREADAFCKSHNLVDYKLRTLQQLRDIHFGYLHKGLHDILPISDDNSDSDELVKAVLLSGLGTVLQRRHPGSATRKRGHAIFNRHDQRVSLSSESVNHGRGTYTTNYLVYINETRSNIRRSTVIRETSFITPLTTLLFMNNRIVMEPITTEDFNPAPFHDPVVVRLEGTRIAFLTERKHALLLCKCKEALTGGVAYYIYQLTKGAEYDKDVNQLWNGILKSLNECLCSAAENITF